MEIDFWHDKWEKNLIGFHLPETNPHLIKYYSHLNLTKGDRIFVPLCGKSNDIIWLIKQGLYVTAIELSPLAVKQFFDDNQLQPEIIKQNDFQIWQTEKIRIFVGDFFKLRADDLKNIDAIYDRASLIALPLQLRQNYRQHLQLILPSIKILLITLEYDQSLMQGPPFAVNDDEIDQLYGNEYQIKTLMKEDVLSKEPHFKKKGVDYMNESVYQLTPRRLSENSSFRHNGVKI